MTKITAMFRLPDTLFINFFLLMTVVTSLFFAAPAHSVPAFARQTDLPCSSCHFQSYPALNAFGRTFRSMGYTLAGSQPKIEGENELSLPSILNASVIVKLRYQLKGDVDGSRGEIQYPDEAALLVGGRASEHVGFLMELGLGPGGADTGDGSLTCTDPADATTCTADTGSGVTDGSTSSSLISIMSRKGDCWDNAPTESFFSSLKREQVHHKHYETRDSARTDIFFYIEAFYNRKRRHSTLGYLNPVAFEEIYFKNQSVSSLCL